MSFYRDHDSYIAGIQINLEVSPDTVLLKEHNNKMKPSRHPRYQERRPSFYYYSNTNSSEVSVVVKYLLFFFNIIFWLAGSFILAVGLWAWHENKVYQSILSDSIRFLDPGVILVCVGSIMFILGFFGCIGALRENQCLLKTYAFSIAIILFLQIASGIVIYFHRDWFRNEFKAELEYWIIVYREQRKLDIQNILDVVQSTWVQCCGIDDYNDWDLNEYYNCTAKENPDACGVPHSCCTDKYAYINGNAQVQTNEVGLFNQGRNFQCGQGKIRHPDNKDILPDRIYVDGCLVKIEQMLLDNATSIGAVLIAICVVQMLGICLAASLNSDISAQIRRWQR